MVDFKKIFIDPSVATATLTPTEPTPTVPPTVSLEPTPPHVHDDAELTLEELLALKPGNPPILVGVSGEQHYTQVLDPLWMEFDEPEERTAGRLLAVIDEVADEALRIHHLQMDFWDRTPVTKVPKSERDRFQKEFLAYLRRIKDYKQTLLDLPSTSTDTDEVYLGLIKRRDGAGPVPDAIMHMYFANQIGVLAEHATEMGRGFLGRVMTGLDRVSTTAREAAELAGDEARSASDRAEGALERLRWWLLGGAVVVAGGATAAAIILTRPRRFSR